MKESNRPLDADAARKLGAVNTAKRWMKRARLVLGLFVLLMGAYAVVSYRAFTLPGAPDPTAKTVQSPIAGIEPGDTLLLQNFSLGREPKVGDVVLYRNPLTVNAEQETLLGRVVGLPGETVKREGATMRIAGRERLAVGFDIGVGGPVKEGDTIPEGSYLIAVDTDAVAYPDSRSLGYIAADNIQRRVVTNFSAWSRPRRSP